MALAATTVWEINASATASNVCGGGFNASNATPGLDYSQAANNANYPAAKYTFTNLAGSSANTSTPTVTSASHTFDSNDPGNIIHINSGTNWTAGWYEIVSVSGGAATLDRACASVASPTNGTFHVGGAMSMQSNTDSTFLAAGVAGNIYWIRAGTYSQGANNWNGGVSGSTTKPLQFIGYNSTRGDNPVGTNRPLLNGTSFILLTGQYTIIQNLNIVAASTNASFGVCGNSAGNNKFINCRFINTTTTASIPAVVTGTFSHYIDCEFCSYNGWGIMFGSSTNTQLVNCYFHDSLYGFYESFTGASSVAQLTGCIFENLTTAGVNLLSGVTGTYLINNCTFYGGEATKTGTGINFLGSTGQQLSVVNCIFYGLATGISTADSSTANYSNYNTFYNNTADVSTITKGPNDIAVNPQFTRVGQYTGTTATSSGSTLTDSGANFANVVANQDFLYIISGTGVTTGIYGITGKTTTTLTTDNSLGTHNTGDIVYEVIWGHNFVPTGTIVTASGLNMPNINTSNYQSLGAAQPPRTFASTFCG